MLFILITLLAVSVLCCNLASIRVGLWQVMHCDTVSRTAEVLNVTQDEIESLNPSLMSWYITPGETYRVPYHSAVSPPATWFTTKNCTPILSIGYTDCGQLRPTQIAISATKTDTAPTTLGIPANGHATRASISPSATSTVTFGSVTTLPTNGPLCYSDGKHANEEAVVMEFAMIVACKAMIDEQISLKDERDNLSFLMFWGTQSFRHYFSIRWTPDCQTPQNVTQSCSQIMYRNWESCRCTSSLC
jgi:hypothetical protein